MPQYIVMLFLTLLVAITCVTGSKSDKIRLENVQVLTLKENRMTTGRRSSPVPQLKCMSNCYTRLPHVVQCTNKGWDGSTVQWECKADFEEGYKFGDLTVICEGYDYPDDPYILTGSCGLEYTIEGDKSSSYGSNSQSYGWNENTRSKKSNWSGMQDLVAIGAFGIIIYALYKTCISGRNEDPNASTSTTNGDFPSDDRRQYPSAGWNIPGMGQTRGDGNGYADASCGGGTGRRARGEAGAGGFWTGMAAGGLMGYMFGNRGGNAYQQQGYYGNRAPSMGSSFFSQSRPSFGSSSRPSTGFAETRRR